MSSTLYAGSGAASATGTATEGAESKAKAWVGPATLGMVGLTTFYLLYRIYQGWAGWKYGLDSTAPEFKTYWMDLFWAQLIIVPSIAVLWWGGLWLTRDRNLSALAPEEELRRYFRLLGMIVIYTFAVYWGASYFAEQDGSWHQTVMRDTSFTPSHIGIFYLSFPVYITFGVAALVYAITRLPRFAERLSVPFVVAVAGPFMILPNVGYNEFGHAFWIMEEWFTAPLHWGFAVLGWTGLAVFGLACQLTYGILDVMRRLKLWEGQEGREA